MTKLLENIFRSVNIALVNELAVLCERMGIDVWEVVDAAATKPYGFMRFEPGPGMGGHCLPVDPFYLAFKAREYDFPAEFVELAGKVNQHQPHYCVERIVRALNGAGKPARDSRVLLLGVSYKAGVGDMREAPALKIAYLLRALGADVAYHDPHVPEVAELGLESGALDDELGRLRRRLRDHRPRRGRLRAGRRRGAARGRLPRRDPRDRRRQPDPALSGAGVRRRRNVRPVTGAAAPEPGRPADARARRAPRSRPRAPCSAATSRGWPAGAWPRRRRRARRRDRDRRARARRRDRRRPRTRSRSRSRATRRRPRSETVLFNMLTGFTGSFALMRLSTWGIRSGWWPFGNVRVGGRHVHHFIPGILLAFLAGGAALVTDERRAREGARLPVRRRDRDDVRRGGAAARSSRTSTGPARAC